MQNYILKFLVILEVSIDEPIGKSNGKNSGCDMSGIIKNELKIFMVKVVTLIIHILIIVNLKVSIKIQIMYYILTMKPILSTVSDMIKDKMSVSEQIMILCFEYCKSKYCENNKDSKQLLIDFIILLKQTCQDCSSISDKNNSNDENSSYLQARSRTSLKERFLFSNNWLAELMVIIMMDQVDCYIKFCMIFVMMHIKHNQNLYFIILRIAQHHASKE